MWTAYINRHVQCRLLPNKVITERLEQRCCIFDSEVKTDKCDH